MGLAKSEDFEYDFYSRCFCPWIGINENPVTGAAHSVLAKYWGDKLGKKKMKTYQASKRGGYLDLEI
ncbi:MAG: PhzF family phenazine biosynthesis protein [Reichenbachiella sp.]